ncbi:MAG: hypothetical protein M1816_000764 [Peltula sp. TS41687]|nr:MAG: hypothetical protein M1816_000764 [Peltula sp. TS41687]
MALLLLRSAIFLIISLVAVPAQAAPVTTTTNVQDLLRGLDVSQAQSADFFPCVRKVGYEKIIIRAYQQACGVGGKTDPNFLQTYQAAKGAGFLDIDAYMFPCTGTQPNKKPCKPIKQQLTELTDVIVANKMDIHRIWFDIEPTSGVCNAWNLGVAGNTKLAKEWIAAIKEFKMVNWGIYANPNQWQEIFGSRSADIASDLPLWAVQVAESHKSLMGGWTTALGKQTALDTKIPGCPGSVDLNAFLD